MANLTNTVWTMKNTVSLSSLGMYEISGYFGGRYGTIDYSYKCPPNPNSNHKFLNITNNELSVPVNSSGNPVGTGAALFYNSTDGWYQTWYSGGVIKRTILNPVFVITGGPDANSDDLENWLIANANKITNNLLNTTWVFDNTSISASNNPQQFALNFYIHEIEYPDLENIFIPFANYNYGKVMSGGITFEDLIQRANGGWEIYDNDEEVTVTDIGNEMTITIFGGIGVANSTIWTWFNNNATQVSSDYTVTATLTNLTASPSIPEMIAPDGTISTILSASSGYKLPDSVTVSGGTATYNSTTGALSVGSLTGNVSITATAVALPSYTFDLSSLSLASGTHSVTAKAKATGYADSQASNAVSYTVSGGYSVTITNTDTSGWEDDIGVYDGESPDSSYLGSTDGNDPLTVVCSSGNLLLYGHTFTRGAETGGVSFVRYYETTRGGVYSVSGDGTITCENVECFVEGTLITLANGTKKPVEEVKYDDELLVWNFYEGKFDSAKPMWIMPKKVAHSYNVVIFENGAVLKLVGSDGYHRIYNDQAKEFTHTGTPDTPNGTVTFTEEGVPTMVVGQEVVKGTVNYYNIITDKHYNLFAEGILTSCRLSNRYAIEDMRYDTSKVNMTENEVKEYIAKLR